jgi:hypothetical protein
MNWKKFNFDHFWVPMIFFILGIIAGILFPRGSKPSKDYPVVVTACYETKTYWYTDYIECDSVKGDTIWKDDLSVINNNIVNIGFK